MQYIIIHRHVQLRIYNAETEKTFNNPFGFLFKTHKNLVNFVRHFLRREYEKYRSTSNKRTDIIKSVTSADEFQSTRL